MKKLLVVALLLVASLSEAQSPCDNKITDKLNHAMSQGAVSKPAAGSTYVDPVFSTPITRISNADPAEGGNAVISTLYNSMRGWNADESQIIAWHRAGSRVYEFYEGDTPYTHLGTITFGGAFSDFTWPNDIEHIIWDSSDPNVLYYPAYDGKGGRGHPLLMKVTLAWPAAPTVTLVRDFNSECVAAGITSNVLSLGHGQDMSLDGKRMVGVRCGPVGFGTDARFDFLYSITDDAIKWSFSSSNGYDSPPWPCPSGTCSWRQYTKQIYNNTGTVTGTAVMANAIEHSGLGRYAVGGWDFITQSAFDEAQSGNLLYWRMDQASPTPQTVVGTANGWPYTLHLSHPSTGAANGSGWVAVGMIGAATGATVLDNEIILGNVGTSEVCRIAHARTYADMLGGRWGYWSETHPQISNDGFRVLFNSDWFNSDTVDLYVADLRPQSTTVITTSLVNGVKTEAYSKQLEALGGTGIYTWTKTAGTWPGGISLSGGGVISGTPTTNETQAITVQACDNAGTPVCDTQALSFTIQTRPTIVEASPLASHTVGSAYGVNFTATGGVATYSWSLASGTLCVGLTLGSDGSLSGTPTTLGTCTFTVRVTDSHAQPISQTKQFQLTVALPSACLPGGSSVCMHAFPSANKVFVRYGQVGLPSNSTCTATIKLNGSQVQQLQTTSGFAKRPTLFTGLSPNTLYTIEVSCTGLGDLAGSVVTTAASGGTRTVDTKFKPNALLPTATQVTVEYGASAVTDNTTTNSSCGSGCTVSLSLAQDIYFLRHTWKTAGGATLAQSDTRYQAVN